MQDILNRLRPYLWPLGGFSFGMHVLMLAPSLYMLLVYDNVLSSRSTETLTVLTLGAAMALLFNLGLEVARSRLLGLAGMQVERELGPVVLSAILRRAAVSGQIGQTAELRDVAQIKGFLSGAGAAALLDAPWLPLYVLVIFLFHPILGAAAVVGIGVMAGMTWLNERLTRPLVEKAMQQSREVSQYMESGLRNAEVINVLGMSGTLTQQWQQRNDQLLVTQSRMGALVAVLQSSGRFLRQFLQILMMGLGAWLVLTDQAGPGVMIATTIILGRLLQPMESLLAGSKALVELRSSLARIERLLAQFKEREQLMSLPQPSGRLSLERVIYSHRPGEQPVIKGVSLSLEPGESLAIIGPSGAGKSTLARLMIGLLQPQSGAVRLDGTELDHWSRDALGPHLGYVPQDVELFSSSVAENIARLQSLDGEAVIEAARLAQAHDMVSRLGEGYATQLGEGGAAVSAGQRQRIALARALYGQPRVVVMDEPNSNLDTEGETALIKAMASLKARGVTQVIVTHRPNLLSEVDKVLVLRDGVIEALGPRDEVLAQVMRRPVQPVTATPAHTQQQAPTLERKHG
jgi:ATP-binding cassette subfamily C exporter for protease/lipase/ATP-binding cassette subfamily C protein EexD